MNDRASAFQFDSCVRAIILDSFVTFRDLPDDVCYSFLNRVGCLIVKISEVKSEYEEIFNSLP